MRLVRLAISAALLMALASSAAHAAPPATQPADPTLTPGKLLRQVPLTADPKQSFALYLPARYDPARKWPVLYGFDPGGNGAGPVAAYQEAAERFGWIVIGSNQSRNGVTIQDIETGFAALWKDTHARLALDDARVYTTGLSGGARVACHFALTRRPNLAGVMAHSADYRLGSRFTALPGGSRTAVVGLAGTREFNYFEVRRMAATARVANVRCRVYEHDAGHAWAPKPVCLAAARYLELLWLVDHKQAGGAAAQALLQEEADDAAQLLQAPERFYDGYLWLKDLAALGKDTLAGAAVMTRVVQAEADPRFPAEQAAWQAAQPLETALAKAPDQLEPALALIDGYRDLRARHAGTSTARHVDLELQSLADNTRILWKALPANAPAEARARLAALGQHLHPDDPEALYQQARVLAETGPADPALRLLAEAVKKGFADAARLRQEASFAKLRDRPAFKKLLAEVEQTPGSVPIRGVRGANGD